MLHVAILFGGTSSEQEISLKTGRFLLETLDQTLYFLYPIFYTQSGEWLFQEKSIQSLSAEKHLTCKEFEAFLLQSSFSKSTQFPTHLPLDVCVVGLHGGSGENGTIQGFLETLNIPYTGSGILGSALAMDKYRANQIFEKNGIPVSSYFEIHKKEFLQPNFSLDSYVPSLPYFVKPTCGGSSVSTGIAKTPEELFHRLTDIFSKEDRALLQKPISGMEVSCGVIERLEGNQFYPRALVPTEIVPSGEFFDFTSKYIVGKSQEITPARISDEMTHKIQSLSVLAHTLLGCRGYSRTDFIIQETIPFILETNTLPGMTETSLIPQQVTYLKESMVDILDLLIQNALSKS
jgi:D-alanine-D-alanine ligase